MILSTIRLVAARLIWGVNIGADCAGAWAKPAFEVGCRRHSESRLPRLRTPRLVFGFGSESSPKALEVDDAALHVRMIKLQAQPASDLKTGHG